MGSQASRNIAACQPRALTACEQLALPQAIGQGACRHRVVLSAWHLLAAPTVLLDANLPLKLCRAAPLTISYWHDAGQGPNLCVMDAQRGVLHHAAAQGMHSESCSWHRHVRLLAAGIVIRQLTSWCCSSGTAVVATIQQTPLGCRKATLHHAAALERHIALLGLLWWAGTSDVLLACIGCMAPCHSPERAEVSSAKVQSKTGRPLRLRHSPACKGRH